MRPRADRPPVRGWLRRGLAVFLGAVLLPVSLGALPQRLQATGQAYADSGTTVPGPLVWQPATGDYGPAGTVTVDRTSNLTDQVVHVSWTGFTPSAYTGGPVPNYIVPRDSNIQYPVRVYECRGLKPSVTDCYGSSLYGANPAKGFQQTTAGAGTTTPEFPSNAAVALTHADGSGAADIEVWTAQQSQTLGCDPQHACSLVVEPNYGGDSIGLGPLLGTVGGCGDHSLDAEYGEATDSNNVAEDFNTGYNDGEQCSWSHHVVVPLSFAPTPAACGATHADFKVQGLEMAARAVQQWRTGACLGASPLNVQYTSGGGEPQARSAFLQRSANLDVALTAYPDTGPAPRPYVYAPLASSGISVAFVVDDPTGRQIRQMRLNARLLAKMLTQSYTLVQASVSQGNPGFASVAGNPACIFDDPEFLQLNPPGQQNGTAWPVCSAIDQADGMHGVAPIVVGGTTDLVRQLTSWIAADPDAEGFLQGAPDPWGMRIDSFYLRPGFSGYPVDAFIPQDSTGTTDYQGVPGKKVHDKQEEWNPILGGLGQVARSTLQAQPTCTGAQYDTSGAETVTKCQPLPVGNRALFAIMDSGQAKAFSLPEAQLENAAGSFVGPSLNGMQAAVADMPVDPATGTQLLPYGVPGSAYGKDAAAYPLTTVQYAMLPTQGLSAAKADRIAQFVRQVADSGKGQIYGSQPGQLAPGFVDLSAAQQTRAQAAALHVSAQDRTLPNGQVAPAAPGTAPSGATTAPPGTTTSGGTGSGGRAGAGNGGGTSGAHPDLAHPNGTGTPLDVEPVAAGRPNPDRAGLQRLLLPGLLIAGAVLLVGGPAALLLGGTGAGGRLRRGLGGAGASVRRGRRALRRRLGRDRSA